MASTSISVVVLAWASMSTTATAATIGAMIAVTGVMITATGVRGCSPERALNKAERMGLNRARIIDAGPRTVKVAGRRFHDREIVVFANERGCPVIYR